MRGRVMMGLGFGLLLLIAVLVALLTPALSGEDAADSGGADAGAQTERPIIGILSQELSLTIQKFYGSHHSYIAASYVKFVEAAGARVAPIFIGRPDSYYREMVESVNGVLLPGGATYFDGPSGYGAAGMALYREVVRANTELGHHLPLLGVCLGMELIAVAAAGGIGRDPRTTCQANHMLSSLTFIPGSSKLSRLFKSAPKSVMSTLRDDAVLVNEHMFCVTPENFTAYGLNNDYDVISTDKDANGLSFVSTFESKHLPIYGLQFHPEKHSYEWKKTKKYPHKPEAIEIGRYFADFFVSEARKNSHSFKTKEERKHLIYGYTPTDTGAHLAYEQLYFFSNGSTPEVPGDSTTLIS